jgi:hypothetical protein
MEILLFYLRAAYVYFKSAFFFPIYQYRSSGDEEKTGVDNSAGKKTRKSKEIK